LYVCRVVRKQAQGKYRHGKMRKRRTVVVNPHADCCPEGDSAIAARRAHKPPPPPLQRSEA